MSRGREWTRMVPPGGPAVPPLPPPHQLAHGQRRRPPPPSIRWPACEMEMKSDSRTGCITRTTPCGRVCGQSRGSRGDRGSGGCKDEGRGQRATARWLPAWLLHHLVPWAGPATAPKSAPHGSQPSALIITAFAPPHLLPCAVQAPQAGRPDTHACPSGCMSSQGEGTACHSVLQGWLGMPFRTQPRCPQRQRRQPILVQHRKAAAACSHPHPHAPIEARCAKGAGALAARKEAAVDARQLGLVACMGRQKHWRLHPSDWAVGGTLR